MHDLTDDGDLAETEKINVVPLADLTLVLLIVLMVLSPMISQSMIHVSVPTITKDAAPPKPTEDPAETPPPPLLITLRTEGYRLNNVPVDSLEKLMEAVALRLGENPKRPVLVQADAPVKVGRLVEVIDRAKVIGALKVSLIKGGSVE